MSSHQSHVGLRGRRVHAQPIATATPPIEAPDSFAPRRKSSKARVRVIIRIGYLIISCLFLGTTYWHGQSKQQVTPAIAKPRVYFVSGAKRNARPIRDQSVPQRLVYKDDDSSSNEDDDETGDERSNPEKCKYMHDWQSASFPTCNFLQEIDMQFGGMALIANGHYRDVFTFKEWNGNVMVMKELRFEYDFDFDDKDRLESHRRDAVAMERLTGSEYIPDIYASCANGAIVDLSPEGTLEQHVLIGDEMYKNYTALKKLEIASQVALAIADVHEADIAHTDIAPKQFLLINGVYKLNDFNRCRFMLFNEKKDEICKFFVPHNPGKGRSPEEYALKWLTQKIDVYSMGNVFYYMLMGFKYFDGVKTHKAQKRVIKGQRPVLSSEVEDSEEPSIRAILSTMKSSQEQLPEDRPTAREVSKYLLDKLKEIKGEAVKGKLLPIGRARTEHRRPAEI